MTHCLRITLGNNSSDLIKEYLWVKTDLHIIVKEIGKQNNPHIHAVLAFNKITEHTFRQGLKTKFGLKGNESFSLEKIKKDLYSSVRYCCKGEVEDRNPVVLYVKKEYNVEQMNSEYWSFVDSVKVLVKEDIETGNKVVKKVRSKTWSEKVFEVIKEDDIMCQTIRAHVNMPVNLLSDLERLEYENARMKVFQLMYKALGVGVKKIGDRIIEELFNGFINAIIQEDTACGLKYSENIYKRKFSIL